jgi:hypothetical protein
MSLSILACVAVFAVVAGLAAVVIRNRRAQ